MRKLKQFYAVVVLLTPTPTTAVYAHKDCEADANWFRHPATNKTWSNYTTCINLDEFEVSDVLHEYRRYSCSSLFGKPTFCTDESTNCLANRVFFVHFQSKLLWFPFLSRQRYLVTFAWGNGSVNINIFDAIFFWCSRFMLSMEHFECANLRTPNVSFQKRFSFFSFFHFSRINRSNFSISHFLVSFFMHLRSTLRIVRFAVGLTETVAKTSEFDIRNWILDISVSHSSVVSNLRLFSVSLFDFYLVVVSFRCHSKSNIFHAFSFAFYARSQLHLTHQTTDEKTWKSFAWHRLNR